MFNVHIGYYSLCFYNFINLLCTAIWPFGLNHTSYIHVQVFHFQKVDWSPPGILQCTLPLLVPLSNTLLQNRKIQRHQNSGQHNWSFVLHSPQSSSSKSSINSSRSWSAPGVTCESHSSATHLVAPWVPVPFGCEPDRMSSSLSSLSVPQSFSSKVSGAPLGIKILL